MSTYNSPTDVTAGGLIKSGDVNNVDAAVAAAFALLPTNALIDAGKITYAVDTGVADSYLVALPQAPTSYADGLHVSMRPLYSNTGACTINVNSLGVKSIKNEANSTPALNDIVAGVPVDLRYSSTTGCFHLIRNSAAAAVNAAASAAAALVSQSAAANSASAALGSQGAAAVSAAAALVSQNAASVSAAAALVSENAASGSASSASSSASTATTQAGISTAQAVISAAQAVIATSQAGTATSQASAASVSAAAALVSENNTAALYDSFDDRYLGAKAADPTLDNDGNALITGALYFNTVANNMRVYSGSAWVVITAYSAASTSAAGLAPQATAPSAGLMNVLGIANGETAYTNKALFDATAPSTQALGDSAATGTAMVSARRDHKHAMPAATVTDLVNDTTPQLAADLDQQGFSANWSVVPAANYTATPASTSTITMKVADMTAKIKAGMVLEYTIGGVVYYGRVAAHVYNGTKLLTVNGSPLSGDITLLRYRGGVPGSMPSYDATKNVDGTANTTVLATGTVFTHTWRGPIGYGVYFEALCTVHDSHATHGIVTMKINGQAVAALTIAANNTKYSTVVDIDQAYYDVNPGEDIIFVYTAGGTGDAAGLRFDAVIVIP